MKCQFKIYDKYHNGFDDTEECQKEGIKNIIFFGDLKIIHLCTEHYNIVRKQNE